MRYVFFIAGLLLFGCAPTDRDKRLQQQKQEEAVHESEILHYPVLFVGQHTYEETRGNGSKERNIIVYAQGFKDTSIVWEKMERDGYNRVTVASPGDMTYVVYFKDKKHCPKFSDGTWPEKYDGYVLGIFRKYTTGQTEFERYLK